MAATSKDLKPQKSRSICRAVGKVKTRQRCVVWCKQGTQFFSLLFKLS